MGYSSQAGWVGLRTQSVKGTYANPGAVAPNQGVFIRTRSGALSGNRELLIPDPEIGGNRDIPDAQLGPIAFVGDFDFYVRMESLPFLLKAALGSGASAGAALTGYTHTIGTANNPPWLSIEEDVAGGYNQFQYTDAVINTLHIEGDADGYLTGTIGIIALKQEVLATPTILANRRIDQSPLLVGTNAGFLYNAAALPAKSFSLDINNNFEDDDFRLGSLFLGNLVPKRREISMTSTIRPDDATLWKTAVWGAPAATEPLGLSTKEDIQLHVVTYEDIPGATAGIKYDWSFDVPQAVIEPFETNPSGDDVLEHDINIRAVRPVAATDIVTTTVLSSYATIP